MLALALGYVIAFIIGNLPGVSSDVRQDASTVQTLIVGAFAAELVVKVAVADSRFEYLRTHWLDVIIVLVPFLRPLRLLVVLPFLARAMVGLNRVMSSFRGIYVLVVGLLTVFTGAGLVVIFERHADGPIRSFGDALWWAITTITTVGYGDTYPVTSQGQAVAVVIMIVGITLFGLLTAGIAAYFVEDTSSEEVRKQGDQTELILKKLEILEKAIEELKKDGKS